MAAFDAKEWKEEGLQLAQAHKRHQWKIADWILEGIALHANATEAYDAAEQIFPEYSRTTFIEWASVARTFPALVRTKDFPDLYFGHFKAALAVTSPISTEETERLRMNWLKQAQDKKLSVAAFRLAIADAFAITQPKPKPEPAAPSPRRVKTAAQYEPEYKLPLSLEEHQKLEKLALARGISPAMLAKCIVVEYLEVHTDELVVGDKRRAEMEAAKAAAQAVVDEEVARRNEYSRQRQAYFDRRASLINSLAPLWYHAAKTDNRKLRATLEDTRDWLNRNPELRIEELEAKVNELLALLPDEAEAAMMAAANEPTVAPQLPAEEVAPLAAAASAGGAV